MFLKQDNNQNGKNKRKFNGSFAPAKIPRGNNSATPENQSNRQNIIKQRNSLPIASAKTKWEDHIFFYSIMWKQRMWMLYIY